MDNFNKSKEAMLSEIVLVIAEVLRIDPAGICEDSRIMEDLGADSVDAVEILAALEERYCRTVDDEEIISFKTPGDILAYLSETND